MQMIMDAVEHAADAAAPWSGLARVTLPVVSLMSETPVINAHKPAKQKKTINRDGRIVVRIHSITFTIAQTQNNYLE